MDANTPAQSAKPQTKNPIRFVPNAIFAGLILATLLRWETLGWPPFVWLAASIVTGMIRGPHARANNDNVVIENRKGILEMVLMGGVIGTMGGLPMIHLATGVFSAADYTLPPAAAILGSALQLPFLWLFWRSHADLGRNWSVSVELRDDHGLITNGVYKRIRHPMYAAIWLSIIAQPLLVQNWVAGCLAIPAFLAMYLLRVPREEAMMREHFGTAYEDYMNQTGRIIPRFNQRKTA